MIIDATCDIEFSAPEDVTMMFMLRPRSGWAQWIMEEKFHLTPQVPVVEFTDVYGNLCQRLTMPAGKFKVAVTCRAEVPDAIQADPTAPLLAVEQLPPELMHFLLPSRYCQSDKMGTLATTIVGTDPRTFHQVARIRTWIHEQVSYVVGASDSSTSALETAHTKKGVCRDFAHLGIALCRAINVPARMVVGFLHELEPMDLHAWFEAYIGGRWYTFDATEGEMKGNRLVVAYGRDAADVALCTQFGNSHLETMTVTVRPAPMVEPPEAPVPVSPLALKN